MRPQVQSPASPPKKKKDEEIREGNRRERGRRRRKRGRKKKKREGEKENEKKEKEKKMGDFPGGAVVKNPPAHAEDTGSIPGPGRSHMPQSN